MLISIILILRVCRTLGEFTDESEFKSFDDTDIIVSSHNGFQFREAIFYKDSLIVAALNGIYKLSLVNLSLQTSSMWLPDKEVVHNITVNDPFWKVYIKDCSEYLEIKFKIPGTLTTSVEKWITKYTCGWHFNVVLRGISSHKTSTLYICATKNLIPFCTLMDIENLHVESANVNHPKYAEDPDYLGASLERPWKPNYRGITKSIAVFDGSVKDDKIFFMGNHDQLFSLSSPKHANLAPSENFKFAEPIKIIEVGNFIYLFFVDYAKEFSSSTLENPKAQDIEIKFYSYVGRLCKEDRGVGKDKKYYWKSLVYSRLLCGLIGVASTISGYQMVWNSLTDVALSSDNLTFYGTFNRLHRRNGIFNGAAICQFKIADVDEKLSDKYFGFPKGPQRDDVKFSRFGACSQNNRTFDTRNLLLAYEPVVSIQIKPILYSSKYSFGKLALEEHNLADVLYITTTSYKILKVVIPRKSDELSNRKGHIVLCRDLPVPTPEHPSIFDDKYVHFIKYHDVVKKLYVGTTWNVLAMSHVKCDAFINCYECVAARDPHCGWNSQTSKCQAMSSGNGLFQDILNGNASSFHQCVEKVTKIEMLPPLLEDQVQGVRLLGSDVSLFCFFKVFGEKPQTKVVVKWYENHIKISDSSCGDRVDNNIKCLQPVITKEGYGHAHLSIVKGSRNSSIICQVSMEEEYKQQSVSVHFEEMDSHIKRMYADYVHDVTNYVTQKCRLNQKCSMPQCQKDSYCQQYFPNA